MASILQVNEIQDRNGNNAIGVDDISYGRSKAWIRFENTGAINNDFNVNSVTDNGTGDYTVHFTDPMPNSNYCFDGTGGGGYGSGGSALLLLHMVLLVELPLVVDFIQNKLL